MGFLVWLAVIAAVLWLVMRVLGIIAGFLMTALWVTLLAVLAIWLVRKLLMRREPPPPPMNPPRL